MLLLPIVVSLPAAAGDLLGQWTADAATVASMSPVPVPFDPTDAAEVMAGPVARRFDTPKGAYATGAVLIDAPIEAVWIALQDGPHEPPGRISFQRLDAPAGARRVYSVLDLPYPLADRHWVAEIRTNRALFDATGGRVWQREWQDVDPALAPSPDPDAAWITETRGAWTVMATDRGTLVLFSVRTVLGGLVPASITQAWAVRTLRASLQQVADRAKAMGAHYTADHERVLTPDGRPIASPLP